MKNQGVEPQTNTIAIHITSRGFGYAIMEDERNLVDWGVVELHRKYALQHILDALQNLSRRYRCSTIVIQAIFDKTGKRKRAQNFVNALKNGYFPMQVIEIPKSKITRAFLNCSNKYDRACEICSQFTFLFPFLPPKRRFYSAEHYRMAFFCGIARGIAYYKSR